MSQTTWSRKDFLKASSLTATGLVLGFYFTAGAKGKKFVTGEQVDDSVIEMCAWILISTSGKVTIMDHRSEMGQGSFQSVPQIIAEELEVDLKDVEIKFAQGNTKKYGSQITGGSSTIRGSYKNLLNLSATAREMLIAAAAAKWNISASECFAKSGHVYHKSSGKKLHYGELVLDASRLPAPKNVTLKKRSSYKLIGRPLLRNDTPMKTNGTAIFGIDKTLPGMLYASVERNPRQRGIVKNYDDSAALLVKGVKKVFKVRMVVFDTFREGVAVVADSSWAALQGRKALKVEWDDSGFEHVNTADIYERQIDFLKTKEGMIAKKSGDPDPILKTAVRKIDVVYETPYQSHSPLEPVNCTAHYQGDKIEIWGPIQAPEMVQEVINKNMGLALDKIVVNMTFLGGGFGRKAFMDFGHEAAVVSKEMNAPVQVLWTREDEMTQGPHRPGISYRGEGVVADGSIKAVKFRMVGQNFFQHMGAPKDKANGSTTEGFLAPYFESIQNISFSDIPFDVPLITMWWRSVYASTNGFAYESFIDELAHEAGKDPLQFRRKHLQDERVQKLIDKMEAVSGWKLRKRNEGYGCAITECFGTTVGQVVKVSKAVKGGVKIDKVWAVMDCGWYVNPDIVHAQVEGSIVMALGAATMHQITFKDGLTQQKNFYEYTMPRITDIPPIEVHIMENDADAGGVGEPGLPPFTPALTNAIFDLTGKRIRKLPFNLSTV